MKEAQVEHSNVIYVNSPLNLLKFTTKKFTILKIFIEEMWNWRVDSGSPELERGFPQLCISQLYLEYTYVNMAQLCNVNTMRPAYT